MLVTVLNNQSLFDLAVQLTGDAINALELARDNGLTPSDNLVPGVELKVPEELVKDEGILQYYKNNAIRPATGLTKSNIDDIVGCEGIGCWAIGIDFKVS
ncbi:hypothetical protein ABMY20_12615 [Tenacibaculum sp. SSH1-16]|uniref:hypothetical protein n=1 Tax=Tenacibaculum sp. SSH1-16 TaxID=3136667 RepID=UPI0032C434DA